MIVERPAGCGPTYLAALGEGNLQTRLFNIPVGPPVGSRFRGAKKV